MNVFSESNNFRYQPIYDREISAIRETSRATDIDDSPGLPAAGVRVVDRGN